MIQSITEKAKPELRWIGRSITYRDDIAKTRGDLKFFSDLEFPSMLWGKVLRSKYPHALIKRMDTSEAEGMAGVVAVLTHKDVPFNHCGVVKGDMPVLCGDKVRFTGDPVALVAADTRATAENAIRKIKVDYELLPIVSDPFEAMKPESPKVHEAGNILHHIHVTYGDVESAFRKAKIVVENTYQTGRQMHMFLETEAGIANIQEDGSIFVRVGGQAPHRDRLQISRALGIPLERIRVLSTPTGGAFGGKEDPTVQIHLALLALKTKRPVKMVWSREESGIAGSKRHPMVIAMKTAAMQDGTITANQTNVVADTGAYASLGAVVLAGALECATGPYHISNADSEGFCVYTNNGLAGAFRGFGAPQMQFALESQVDQLAERLSMDRITIRKRNALRKGEVGPFGLPMKCSSGLHESLEKLESSGLYRNRDEYKASPPERPWIRRGVGVASALKGFTHLSHLDHCAASVEFTNSGKFVVGVSCPDLGQRNRTAYAQIAAEALHCDIDDIALDSADTADSPDGGGSSSSRAIYLGGNAILATAEKMLDLLLEKASNILKEPKEYLFIENESIRSKKNREAAITYSTLAEQMHRDMNSTRTIAEYVMPRHDRPRNGAAETPHTLFSFASALALVEVDMLTGQTKVLRFLISPDAGTILNRNNFEGQIEGALVQGVGYALMEDTVIEKGEVRNTNFTTYVIPCASDAPEIEVDPVEIVEETGPFGAKGAGELGIVLAAPAICNAIYDAAGARIFQIPATPERVFKAIGNRR
jgi:CO/xanthine dehydrogenase Mo-binding subunit